MKPSQFLLLCITAMPCFVLSESLSFPLLESQTNKQLPLPLPPTLKSDFRIFRQKFYIEYKVIVNMPCYVREEIFRREENASANTIYSWGFNLLSGSQDGP